MGKLYKKDGKWKFSAVGDPTSDKKLEATVKTAQTQYL
jgi:tellurium resistance protein TerZ